MQAGYSALRRYAFGGRTVGSFMSARKEGCAVRKVRIDGVYRLSAALDPLKRIDGDESLVDLYIKLIQCSSVFDPFMEAWGEYLGAAKELAATIRATISNLHGTLNPRLQDKEKAMLSNNQDVYYLLLSLNTNIGKFETVLEQEAPRINTYLVDQVGGYSMQHMIEDASVCIPEEIRSAVPESARKDYAEAGRCLAFGLFTACGFHLTRSLEAVVVAYHDKLTGSSLGDDDRNWGAILKRLLEAEADERLTSLLAHIKDQDRNPIIHPERSLSREEAMTAFSLTGGTMMEFAKALRDFKTGSAALVRASTRPSAVVARPRP